MSDVDSLQSSEEAVAQLREAAAERERQAVMQELRKAPLADTAAKRHRRVTATLDLVRSSTNMREGPLPEVEELAISLIETGLLHPPLVRETGEQEVPYELVAGARRLAAMRLVDEADGAPREWELDLREGMTRREALTLQFAENFHQRKPEPITFARAVRQIMIEDPELTAAEVSRMTGAPAEWTRSALRLLELPAIAERVEAGDLAFTAADMVRRAISTGRVGEAEGVELARSAADGEITSGELRHAVGYVPPKPENYDELAAQLDRSRWDAQRAKDAGGSSDRDADQRDWERGGHDDGPGYGASGPDRGADDDAELRGTALDAYLLGRLLRDIAPEHRDQLGIGDREGETYDYAFTLRPHERVDALRTLAAQLLASDPLPPHALRGVAAVAGAS